MVLLKIQKLIAILLTLACICSCLLACGSPEINEVDNLSLDSKYDEANQLFLDGKYEEAIAAFKALGSYRDAEHRMDEASYNWAKQLLDDEKWPDAAKVAKSIVTNDGKLAGLTELLLLQCDLKQAEEFLAIGKVKQAIELCQTVKKKATDSSIIVAADNLHKRCQEALSMGDVNKLLEDAKTEYENKNWHTVITLCNQICEIAPNTDTAATATNLQNQAEKEIDTELTDLINRLEDARNDNAWNIVLELATTILNDYSEYVSDKDTIENYKSEASQKITEEAKAKLEPALKKLKKKYDDVEDITWYMPSSEPRYINDRCVSYLYIGDKDNGSPWVRWRTIYVDDEWIYFDELIINVDGTVYSIYCNYDDTVRDSNTKNHWEYVDFQPKSFHLEIISSIVNSKSAVIRFSNNDDNKSYDYTITQKEKDGFRDILEAYELMKCLD